MDLMRRSSMSRPASAVSASSGRATTALVIASPAGAYFTGGVKPVSIWVSENRVRAVPGGMGEAKTGGNYAASLLAQAEAAAKGCEQVVYLDAVEHRWVEELGGITAISISHPHYYSSMVEWAETFDARIYLHAADREWVMRPSDRVVFWEEETLELGPGLTLVRCGGHYEGGTVLHWAAGGRESSPHSPRHRGIPGSRLRQLHVHDPNLIPLSEQRSGESWRPRAVCLARIHGPLGAGRSDDGRRVHFRSA